MTNNNNLDLSNFSMLDLFNMEVETQINILNENLLALESKAQQSEGMLPLLEALMRAAHCIKGAARIVQIEVAVKIAHVMEDCFVAAMDRTITLEPSHIDLLLHGVDFLLQISQVNEFELTNWVSEHDAEADILVNEIAAILGRRKADQKDKESQEAGEKSCIVPHTQDEEDLLDDIEPFIELNEIISGLEESDLPPFSSTPPSDLKETIAPITSFSQSTVTTSESNETTATTQDRFVRLSADNLNRLLGLAGESLVEATSLHPLTDSLLILKKNQRELSTLLEKLQLASTKCQLNQESKAYLKAARQKERECREILSDRTQALELFAYRSVTLSDRLYREVIASHMRPFADGVQSFPRMVRDLARQLDKRVRLEILGKLTPVDRDILKKLEAPLTHILRNAIDHGIESPQERLDKGKSEAGTIRLEAVHRFGMLSITVTDDGQGIDFAQLRQSVVQKQLVTPEMSTQLSENELTEFLFLPGFSTANQITEISGRGVGLNIAKTMVQEVGGNLQAISKPEKGMTFQFQLPITLSVIRTLLVEISGEPYAFPLTRIEQLVMLHQTEISCVENRQYFTLNEQHIGLVRADQVLELTPSSWQSQTLPIVIISDQLNRYGLVVDKFLGERNLVVRPLDSRLGKVQDISAAALLEDGSPVLIVDALDLVRSIDKILTNNYLNQVSRQTEDTWAKYQKRILVVDDSITVREMERKLLQNQGYHVDVAVDGMEGWNAILNGEYDLIISDIDMPRLNGIKLVKQLKNHPQLKSTPVIIVSYKDREEDRLQGLEAGADYYLTKSSFHDDTLVNAVIDLIGK